MDLSQRGSLDLLVNFHFGVSWVGGLKTLHQDSRNHEVRNPEKVESFVVGPAPGTVSKFGISSFWVS
jgi:hypothetical protein